MDLHELKNEFNEDFAKYLCNEMDAGEKEAFAPELASLDPAEAERIQTAWNRIGSLPPAFSSQNGWKRFSQQHRQPVHFTRNRYFLPAAAAALAVLVALAFLLTRQADTGKILQSQRIFNDYDTPLATILSDQSLVKLSQHSTLTVESDFNQSNRDVQLDGEAYFSVEHSQVAPFRIQTPGAGVEVIGTAFSIRSDGNDLFEIMVHRGKVLVKGIHSGSSYTVTAGENFRLVAGMVEPSSYQGLAGETKAISFRDEPLKNIIRVLNAEFGANFELEGKGLDERLLTVTFKGQTNEELANLIARALNIKSRNENGKTIFMEN